MQQKMDDRRFQAAHGFRMEMLSIMFGMQMLSRVMKTFLKSAVETYNKATNSQGQFTKQTMRLTAAWTFLKFRLIDALGNSDLFKSVIDFIITLVDGIASMDDEAMERVSVALVAIAVAFSVGAFLASWTLLMDGLKLFAANEGAVTTVGNMLTKIAALGFIGMGISLLTDDDISKQVAGFGNILMGTGLFKGVTTKGGKMLFLIGAALDFAGKAGAQEASFTDILSTAFSTGIAAGLVTMNPIAGIAVGLTAALVLSQIHPEADFFQNLFTMAGKMAIVIGGGLFSTLIQIVGTIILGIGKMIANLIGLIPGLGGVADAMAAGIERHAKQLQDVLAEGRENIMTSSEGFQAFEEGGGILNQLAGGDGAVAPTIEAYQGIVPQDTISNMENLSLYTGSLSENAGNAHIETDKLKTSLINYKETLPLATDEVTPLTTAIGLNETAVTKLDGTVFDLNDTTLEFTENTLLESEAHLQTAESIEVEIAALYRLRDAINAVNAARNSRYRTRSSS
jgi:hypothetical protein